MEETEFTTMEERRMKTHPFGEQEKRHGQLLRRSNPKREVKERHE